MSNAGKQSHAGLYFILAAALVVIGGFASPLWLALALLFIAAGFATRPTRPGSVAGIGLLVLVVLVFGYGVGKDMAHRDNARSATAATTGT